MSDTEKPIKHPTQVLSDDIFSFTQDIECLHTTLPLIMQIMTTVQEETNKRFHTFIDEHALEKSENDDQSTYALKVEDVAKHDRLRRQHVNSLTAMRLIPRHFITSLVSQYDSFLGRVIRFIFTIKPQILNASEKVIPYTDLIQFANIDAARDYIIEKEVETVIRNHPKKK